MINLVVQGLALSGLYALIAVGFTMVFSVGRVLNLAYGVYLMIGGYAYYTVVQVERMPKIVGFVVAILAGAVFAVLVYRLLARRLLDNPKAVAISTLILAVVVQALIILIYRSTSKSMWPVVQGVFRYEDLFVTYNILVAMVVSWLAIGLLLLFVRYTRHGRAIQAVSMNRKGAVISGVNPDQMNLLTWAISGGLGALAGVFFATYTQLHPAMWVAPLIVAVAVVVVGGIGSIIGSLVVAHIIGFMETATTTFVAAELRGVFTMILIIVVLIVAPKGLFGRGDV